ncbi:MAG: hypothetical protein ABI813_10955 [Bacteroidota bacterium]
MNIFYKRSWLFLCTVIFCGAAFAQQDWPKSITGNNGELIKIYQPQVESYSGNTVKSRSAISVIPGGKTDPVFGAFWWEANVADNGSAVSIQSLQVTNIKFPDGVDEAATSEIKEKLESAIPQMNINISKVALQHSLDDTRQQATLTNSFNNAPPKVIYTTKPSMLVLIDGEPKMQNNSTYGVEVVVNSPFTIVKNKDGRFYLYGGKQWFSAPAATGPYNYVANVPDNLQQIENAVKNSQNSSNTSIGNNKNGNDDASSLSSNTVPEIIVSTQPAELIQSDGEANFTPVENTGLLYVKNSSNDIFMDVNSQQYYVLLSGRWYRSSSLKSQWQFIEADRLPVDFAKIPAGSPKDNVLASVGGTDQADEAITDAAIPQTAKVDRKTATANVSYDGDPQFENISGTRLQYAVNASATVLKMEGMYYAVDNGVWFQSNSASGPWEVSTTRPEDVDRIPPSYPVYNSKYVYVYDATPDYVYTGYTPGYLNAYVYGSTLVYGTGYYYRPWWRHHYYARPYTWGFSMNYTPWYGWGFGYDFGYDWFDIGFGMGSWWGGGFGYGGWWGPSIYRPAYAWGRGYNHNYGYYGYNRGIAYRNSTRINIHYNNNIYNNRRNVYAYNNRSFVNNNRYGNNYNRNGALNGNRGNGYGRYNNNGGNRTGNNNGFNNGNRAGNNGGFTNGNRTRNNTGFNNSGRRTYSPNANGSSDNNRFNNNNNNNRFGNGNRSNNSNSIPETNTPQRQYSPRSYDNNRNNNQAPVRQPAYNPQRSTDNSRSFSRPQSIDRPQRSSAPIRSFNNGEGGGSRPSFNNGGGGGGRSGGSGGGGSGGGGGGRHGR